MLPSALPFASAGVPTRGQVYVIGGGEQPEGLLGHCFVSLAPVITFIVHGDSAAATVQGLQGGLLTIFISNMQ